MMTIRPVAMWRTTVLRAVIAAVGVVRSVWIRRLASTSVVLESTWNAPPTALYQTRRSRRA